MEHEMTSDDDYVYDEESGEWMPASELASRNAAAGQVEVRDSVGNILYDGDQVVLVKDLDVKGAGTTLKVGTVIKSIRLTGDPQEIDCRHERSEEHTSELQSLMRNSYAVFCWQKK